MKYVFYFDESFHDRSISVSEVGKFNIATENSLDNYIGVFWGCKSSELQKNIKLLQDFENKQKKLFKMSEETELKSTSISKKNFTYGVSSFNKNTTSFYYDFFNTLIQMKPIFQIDIISKMEYFCRNLFRNVDFSSLEINPDVFYYILTKFLIMHSSKEVNRAIYFAQHNGETEQLKDILLDSLELIITTFSSIPRKEREIRAFSELQDGIRSIPFNVLSKNKLDFQYFPNFDGLLLKLNEVNINPRDIKLTLDEDNATFQEALKYPFRKVKTTKSNYSIQVRLSDLLSGFIGRFMYALSNDKSMAEDSVLEGNNTINPDYESLRYISPQWFDLTEEKFNLYHLVNKAIINNTTYWSYLSLSYSDESIVFISLISYISSYFDFNEFKNIPLDRHVESHTLVCLERLDVLYKSFYI